MRSLEIGERTGDGGSEVCVGSFAPFVLDTCSVYADETHVGHAAGGDILDSIKVRLCYQRFISMLSLNVGRLTKPVATATTSNS